MKKIILIIISFCITLMAQALVSKTINVTTAGSLSTLLTSTEKSTITNLTVTGTIDARDFEIMRDIMPLLNVLDLNAANIATYTGIGGTDQFMSNIFYPANTIPASAFLSKTSLTSIISPYSATAIGNNAFEGTGLKSFTITPSITSIGGNAFKNCTSLNTVNFNALNCTQTSDYLYTFDGCNALATVNFANNIGKIPDYIFYGCTGITSIIIPSSVSSIGQYAFFSCTGLTSVIISEGVSSIGNYIFRLCSNLTSVTIPTTVTSIPIGAFSYCIKLKNISIPSSTNSIGTYAFEGTGLTSVTIPYSVTAIGNYSFQNCTSLQAIFVYNPIPVVLSSSSYVFFNVGITTCILHVPIGKRTSYKAALQWKDFVNVVEDLPNAVNNASIIKFKVSSLNGQAIITGIPAGETISIYNLQGTAIYNQQATSETVTVNFPAHGVYVVRVGGESMKVVN